MEMHFGSPLIDHTVLLFYGIYNGMGMELAAKSLGLGIQQKMRGNGPSDIEGGYFQREIIVSRTCLYDYLFHFKIKV